MAGQNVIQKSFAYSCPPPKKKENKIPILCNVLVKHVLTTITAWSGHLLPSFVLTSFVILLSGLCLRDLFYFMAGGWLFWFFAVSLILAKTNDVRRHKKGQSARGGQKESLGKHSSGEGNLCERSLFCDGVRHEDIMQISNLCLYFHFSSTLFHNIPTACSPPYDFFILAVIFWVCSWKCFTFLLQRIKT